MSFKMAETEQSLPLSIKLIGTFWILKGVFLIIAAVLVILGASFVATYLKGHLPMQASLAVLMFVIILASIPIYIGKRILAKGKVAWNWVFIVSVLFFISSISKHNIISLPFIVIYGLSAWKLYEHRNIFGV